MQVRRIEEVLINICLKHLKSSDVEITKCASNTMGGHTGYILTYRFMFRNPSVGRGFKSLLDTLYTGKLCANVFDTYFDWSYMVSVVFSWNPVNALHHAKLEDSYIKKYLKAEKLKLKGSYTQDIKILSDFNYPVNVVEKVTIK